ncbi:hypothetical protein SAMN05444141_105381 [Pseudovibrio denitrificans]|uniref:Uncharacterized protein n=1 Tax=Pseudovibrio denitrificans TaxID=258256 RepID=A0A1I7CAN3_9HYPH|nr:hypothetical protein SAMN05444141_105381 [Pseudovibrio denitrificans]
MKLPSFRFGGFFAFERTKTIKNANQRTKERKRDLECANGYLQASYVMRVFVNACAGLTH